MTSATTTLTIVAGGGALPLEVAHAALADGHTVSVIGIGGEADLANLDARIPSHMLGWGQIGALQNKLAQYGSKKLVIVGSVRKRPDFKDLKVDWGAVQMLPRFVSVLMSGGDATVLDSVSKIISDQGYCLVGAHEVAPKLLAAPGHLAGPDANSATMKDVHLAAHAAWTAGHLDMGQGAVCVSGRVVAMEGAEGTDGQLERVQAMREARRFSAQARQGALAKCTRPQQDLRLDMPAVGPQTIENAAKAGLSAIAIEAGKVLIAQRDQVERQCRTLRITLIGLDRNSFVPEGRQDRPA